MDFIQQILMVQSKSFGHNKPNITLMLKEKPDLIQDIHLQDLRPHT